MIERCSGCGHRADTEAATTRNEHGRWQLRAEDYFKLGSLLIKSTGLTEADVVAIAEASVDTDDDDTNDERARARFAVELFFREMANAIPSQLGRYKPSPFGGRS